MLPEAVSSNVAVTVYPVFSAPGIHPGVTAATVSAKIELLQTQVVVCRVMPFPRSLPVRRASSILAFTNRAPLFNYHYRLVATTAVWSAPLSPPYLQQSSLRKLNTMSSAASAPSFTDSVVQAVKTMFVLLEQS